MAATRPPGRHRDDASTGPNSEPASARARQAGMARILSAAKNTAAGVREGFAKEPAIRQELVVLIIAVPLSFVLARDVWIWVALIASLLVVLAVEFLNTAIERLCDHVQPERHDAIRITKDLASAGVFFALALAALVWITALVQRFLVLP